MLPYAVEGYQAIGQPAATKYVQRMLDARNEIIARYGNKSDGANISDIAYELSDDQLLPIEQILDPYDEDVDFDVFDKPEELALFVREHYAEFQSCEVAVSD